MYLRFFGSPANACADLLPLVVLVVIPFCFQWKNISYGSRIICYNMIRTLQNTAGTWCFFVSDSVLY